MGVRNGTSTNRINGKQQIWDPEGKPEYPEPVSKGKGIQSFIVKPSTKYCPAAACVGPLARLSKTGTSKWCRGELLNGLLADRPITPGLLYMR